MTDSLPTLLLTRPEPQSQAFLNMCEALAGHRLPAVISPIMRIEATGELPDLDRYETIIFTSGNGVRCFLEKAGLAGRKVVTVGEGTAELARANGAEAEALGEDIDAFLAMRHLVTAPALFCCGVHSRGNLARELTDAGIQTNEVVIYDQVSQPLTVAARQLLTGTGSIVAPVFSPRSARLLCGHGLITAPLTIIAMSRNVAEAWQGPGRVLTAEAPNSRSMCCLTVSQF